MATGARPKTSSSPHQWTVPVEDLEEFILKHLCINDGSLSFNALYDAVVENKFINKHMPNPRGGLQKYLTDGSPHNVFRLDEDVKRNECTVRYL